MRDIHCHILPDVDDGARDLSESLQMLQAAKEVGITSIVCTPHCRRPYFDFDKMWEAFRLLQSQTEMPLQMGFEVNVTKLLSLGLDWVDHLHFDGSDEFLLELEDEANEVDFREYRRIVYEIQCQGYDVIIAHPERYLAIQHRPELAYELVRMGCRLQASGDFIYGGRTPDPHKGNGASLALASHLSPKARRVSACARKLFKEGWYSHIASDAHCPWHYEAFQKAWDKHASTLAQ